ncbi:glycoside hydrolase family 88 protein [Paenibacillus agaridevorans]|uniref:glycoside hydrolase family 88 protein n=1 Tax=Paenibacillus agaridevorans TaxID=171404 RepID=UPI001BE458B0|nr:glycoside hydrolase family 88 protein [Paenibacillus agaridevorans]
MMSYGEILKMSVEKTRRNMREMGNEWREFPLKSCFDGRYFSDAQQPGRPLSHVFCWTQGFFAGMAGISYAITKDESFLNWLRTGYDYFYNKVNRDSLETMHDLGFLYSPYSVFLYRQTGETRMKELSVKAADELIKRYVPNGHYIQAWGRMNNRTPDYVDEELAKDHFFTQSEGLAIIDCMMNLPLLFWASRETGHPVYANIAKEHIRTTMRHFIRGDGSVNHAYRFSVFDGAPVQPENYCGYATDSWWARGTAWAIYGLAIAYDYTLEPEYFALAERLALRFVEQVGEDAVPVWDFRLPKETPAIASGNRSAFPWDASDPNNLTYNKDTSAAAIVVCAIQRMSKHGENAAFERYKRAALESLANRYFNPDKHVNGLLTHSNGRMEYTSYGDYFFMEALAHETHGLDTCW